MGLTKVFLPHPAAGPVPAIPGSTGTPNLVLVALPSQPFLHILCRTGRPTSCRLSPIGEGSLSTGFLNTVYLLVSKKVIRYAPPSPFGSPRKGEASHKMAGGMRSRRRQGTFRGIS